MFWDKIKEAFSKKKNNDNKANINTQKTEKNRFKKYSFYQPPHT